jgi:hypothetical protein
MQAGTAEKQPPTHSTGDTAHADSTAVCTRLEAVVPCTRRRSYYFCIRCPYQASIADGNTCLVYLHPAVVNKSPQREYCNQTVGRIVFRKFWAPDRMMRSRQICAELRRSGMPVGMKTLELAYSIESFAQCAGTPRVSYVLMWSENEALLRLSSAHFAQLSRVAVSTHRAVRCGRSMG